jgi:hypothetical protein
MSEKITYFPKGTVVKFNGIPCELLCDVPYYSATFGSEIRQLSLYHKFFWLCRRLFDCPQPTIQEPRTNLPKSAFDPYDTIEQQDFIQKGK